MHDGQHLKKWLISLPLASYPKCMHWRQKEIPWKIQSWDIWINVQAWMVTFPHGGTGNQFGNAKFQFCSVKQTESIWTSVLDKGEASEATVSRGPSKNELRASLRSVNPRTGGGGSVDESAGRDLELKLFWSQLSIEFPLTFGKLDWWVEVRLLMFRLSVTQRLGRSKQQNRKTGAPNEEGFIWVAVLKKKIIIIKRPRKDCLGSQQLVRRRKVKLLL